MAEKQNTFSLLPKIINGGIAGLIGVTCVFPLDLVKTRLQNQQIGPNGERMYANIIDAFRKTISKEGFLGMYKGAGVNLLLITPEKALKLAVNDYFRFHLATDGKLPVYRQVIAGGLAGVCQMIVTTPMELLKIQMQDAGRVAAAKIGGSTKVTEKLTATKLALNIIKHDGFLGFYKGTGATALRDVSFSMMYFPLFAILNDLGPKRGDGDTVFWFTFMSGLAAGSFSAVVVTPADVVKTRLQTTKKAIGEDSYKGIPEAFMKIYKKEGSKAFFKGGFCRMMVIAPLFAIAQTVYYIGIAEWLLGIEKHT